MAKVTTKAVRSIGQNQTIFAGPELLITPTTASTTVLLWYQAHPQPTKKRILFQTHLIRMIQRSDLE
jgi:sensor domain CHASE-containing protein